MHLVHREERPPPRHASAPDPPSPSAGGQWKRRYTASGMSFNSLEFLVFFAVFAAIWPWVRRHDRVRTIAIVSGSFVFYAWWDPRFLPLLVFSGLIDYGAALAIERWPAWRRTWLWVSIGANLATLFFFKYAAWFSGQLTGVLGMETPAGWLADVILPLGISFYTFQSMSYTIDVYRREIRAERDVLLFFAFLTMFPQLVAGPIVRARDLIEQLRTPGAFTPENRWYGVQRIAEGFFLKCVIADNLAPSVDRMFAAAPDDWSGVSWWLGALLFSLQIFGDFVGYSSIAIGLAAWMGYHFRENFLNPFRATSPRDYTRRWHVSLGTWLRDYVYRPLVNGPTKSLGPAFAICATMLLSGLWHGANWTFVVWGGLYAVGMLVQRAIAATAIPRILHPMVAIALAWSATLALTLVARMVFRSSDIGFASQVFRRMATLSDGEWFRLEATGVVGLVAFMLIAFAPLPRSAGAVPRILSTSVAATFAMLLSALLLRGPANGFIYFQF